VRRLCKKCSYPVGPLTLRCRRCHQSFPYWRFRKTREKVPQGDLVARSKDCPRCGSRTRREKTPLRLRPVRWLMGDRFSYRVCQSCGWRGASFHDAEPRRRHRSPRPSGGDGVGAGEASSDTPGAP
jgi:hypothetical protein